VVTGVRTPNEANVRIHIAGPRTRPQGRHKDASWLLWRSMTSALSATSVFGNLLNLGV